MIIVVETEANQRYFSESMEETSSADEYRIREKPYSQLHKKRPRADRQTIIGKGKLQELVHSKRMRMKRIDHL